MFGRFFNKLYVVIKLINYVYYEIEKFCYLVLFEILWFFFVDLFIGFIGFIEGDI